MATSDQVPQVRPKRILVIGGGPAGLVTLRNLVELGEFDKVELVERRDDVGGVWYLDNPEASPSRDSKAASSKPRWPSPAYPNLVGNVLPEFLSFSHFPFPPPPSSPDQPFPTLSQTHDYLRAFAAPLRDEGLIRLNTEVTRVEELDEGQGWKVATTDWSADEPVTKEEVWDAVVVAVCWYDHPVWPETPGLELLKEKGLAVHANDWRGPKGLEDKRVLVIGNGNSSNDIAAQLAPFATPSSPVYRSIRRPAFPGFVSLPDERIHDVAPVQSYSLSSSSPPKITAHLKDGTSIPDLDIVEVGTGYRPFPSFIYVRTHPAPQNSDFKSQSARVPLMNERITPHRVPSLHRLILYAYNPSLAFIGTAAISYTPFTIADVSSTWLALAWRGLLSYPASIPALLAFERERLDAVEMFRASEEVGGNPSSLFVYGVLAASEEGYAAGLKADIVRVRPELKDVLPEWSVERTAKREGMFKVKRRALELNRERAQAAKEPQTTETPTSKEPEEEKAEATKST